MAKDKKQLLEVDDESAEEVKPFSGLDLKSVRCFGFAAKGQDCWKSMADQIEDVGIDYVDIKRLENSLAKDVDQSYLRIAEFKLANVDDDMVYEIWFDNNKGLWGIAIQDSPKAEMTIEERADFFKSDMFKKIAKKTYYRLLDAKNSYYKNVNSLVQNGGLLDVDVIKLEAILSFISSDYFLKNIEAGKYLSY